MKKVKPVVARNAKELAKALGLTPADAVEFEIRSALNDKIIEWPKVVLLSSCHDGMRREMLV